MVQGKECIMDLFWFLFSLFSFFLDRAQRKLMEVAVVTCDDVKEFLDLKKNKTEILCNMNERQHEFRRNKHYTVEKHETIPIKRANRATLN